MIFLDFLPIPAGLLLLQSRANPRCGASGSSSGAWGGDPGWAPAAGGFGKGVASYGGEAAGYGKGGVGASYGVGGASASYGGGAASVGSHGGCGAAGNGCWPASQGSSLRESYGRGGVAG